MHRTAIFTIVTKNYVGLANVLMQSIADNNKVADCESFIFLADEIENINDLKIKSDHIIACKDAVVSSNSLWTNCAFKYNVTEFCTFLKPYCIEYLYNKGITNVIYLDPDIYVFNDLSPLVAQLDKYAAVLTPHVTYEESCAESPVFSDLSFANNGIFNLGFIAVNNSAQSKSLISWWKRMVTENGFMESVEGIATDQKWMDFAPAFLGTELLIERAAGYNAAFWNIQERIITATAEGIFVKSRKGDNDSLSPLYFFHFSALNYTNIYDFSRSKYPVDFVALYPDLKIIFEIYGKHITGFNEYNNLKYSYSTYDNGIVINYLNRRLYRRLVEKDPLLADKINPFESKGPFYKTLKKYKLLAVNTVSPTASAASGTANTSNIENKSSRSYIFFRLIAKMLGANGINKMINAGKSMSKAEGHTSWLSKDFYKNLKG